VRRGLNKRGETNGEEGINERSMRFRRKIVPEMCTFHFIFSTRSVSYAQIERIFVPNVCHFVHHWIMVPLSNDVLVH
jgi:hypothetical protein